MTQVRHMHLYNYMHWHGPCTSHAPWYTHHTRRQHDMHRTSIGHASMQRHMRGTYTMSLYFCTVHARHRRNAFVVRTPYVCSTLWHMCSTCAGSTCTSHAHARHMYSMHSTYMTHTSHHVSQARCTYGAYTVHA